MKVELVDFIREEKEVPTFGRVLLPVFDLDEDRFEQRAVDVNPAFTESPRWADVGYYSRHSQSAVFVVCHEQDHPNLPLMATVVMTNDPIQKEVYEA